MDKQRELWKQEQNMHVWPFDGAAATWQIPDEANGFGIVGLRLFNLIPPFDDCMLLFFFPEGLGNGSVQSLHRKQKFHSTSE